MMKWIKIIDLLNEISLFEMAHRRRDVIRKVTDLSPLIFDNLIKLFVFESPENHNHWITEINGWLRQINILSIKPDSRKPSKQELFNWLILDSGPHYDEIFIDMQVRIWKKNEYKTIPLRDTNYSFILNKIFFILDSACKDIAAREFSSIADYL